MKTSRHLLIAAALLAMTSAAFAQSSPGLVTGQIPSAAQWNSYFAAKQNVNTTLTGIGAGTINPSPGTYGDATHCATVTVGASGLITSASQSTSCPGSAGVTSFNSRTGAVAPTSGDYAVGQVTGAAPLASPTFTGTVTIPSGAILGTPASGTLTNLTGLIPSSGLAATGTPDATHYLRGDNSWQTIPAGVVGANPTATIGATAVNGSATTFMRSDAAPPLPATLPALSGINLTALNGSNIASGTVADARLALGKSVVDSNGVLESVLPPQTVTGASKTFATADLQYETRRSNSGSAMTDTFPASSAAGMVNGAKITENNVDVTGTITITPGAGTTISGSCNVIEPSRSVAFIYDLANTTWRSTYNTCSGASFSSVGTNVVGDMVTMSSIYGKVQDSGIASASLATSNNTMTLTNKSISGANNALTAIPSSALVGAINPQTGTTYPVASGDGGKIVSLSNASPVAVTLFSGATAGAGFGTDLDNIGAGLATVTLSSGNFDTGQPAIAFVKGQEVFPWSDGTNFHAWVSLPPIATSTVLGNLSGHSEYPVGLTATQLTTLCNSFTSSLSGCAPASGGGTTNFLRADGTWAAAGGGLSAIAANSVLANFTGSSAVPIANAVNGGSTCSDSTHAIGFTAGTGFGCQAITATGTPGGSNTQLQYNNSGALGGISTLVTDGSGRITNSATPAASTPAETISGAPFTGGSGTTTFPLFYLNSGTAPTVFPTTGTIIGANGPSGFTGELIGLYTNGTKIFGVNGSTTLVTMGGFDLASGSSGLANGMQLVSANHPGIYASSTNIMDISSAGGVVFKKAATDTNAAGWGLWDGATSGTVPSFSPNRASSTTGIGAQASGNMSLIAGGVEQARITSAGFLVQNGVIGLKTYTVAALPGSPASGYLAIVTDANAACTFGGAPTGGGSTVCKVWYNGTGWVEGFVFLFPMVRRRRKSVNENLVKSAA